MKRLICYLIAVFTLAACTSEIGTDSRSMDASLEGKPVTVTFSVPGVRLAPSTKSIETGDGLIAGEPYLDPDKLYIVACGYNQSIKYIRKAEIVLDANDQPDIETVPISSIPDYPITDTDGTETVKVYKFKVQLDLSDSERTIHFLGNIDENQLITGSYSYQVLPSLLSYEGKQAYWQKVNVKQIHPKTDPVTHQPVMEGGSYLPDDEVKACFEYVPLVRNYAKIQVTDATDPADGFELYSYAVIYYPKRGSVVPYRSNASDYHDSFTFNAAADYHYSGYEKCDFPTLEETLAYRGNMPAGVTFDYEVPDASLFENPDGVRVIRYDKNNPDQGFYIYERGVPTTTMDPTYVIIRGKFGDSDYYYYRLDLMETKVVNYESVYQYYPIYRNFKYNIQLNRISSQGVSTPEAATYSSGAEDISADISMRHLGDISNGISRLVVEPYMSRTNPLPNDDGYCYLYARFFDDVNSAVPNTDWGAVTVELVSMENDDEDILVLYDDQEHEVHGGGFFYPEAQEVGGEPGFRVIRFKTKTALDETKTQKIKITGRNHYSYEQYPLYREVEISIQKKQDMLVACTPEIPLQTGSPQVLSITIPSGLPTSMFPLAFTIEAEAKTLTPNNNVAGNNLPVVSGISISENPEYAGRNTFQFVRTLTLDEYQSLAVNEGKCTFYCYFKSNRSESATTIWVQNEYFNKGHAVFQNPAEPKNHFYVKAAEDEDCRVMIKQSGVQYKIDDGEWQNLSNGVSILIERGHKAYFKSTIKTWNTNKFFCYKASGFNSDARNGSFSVGGNIASLLVGDAYEQQGSTVTGFSFVDFLKGHSGLIDASELILPMMSLPSQCYKSMFDSCTGLKKAPALPATTLSSQCYRNMFYGCSSLVDAPYLLAENITSDCYQRMFWGCSSLKLIKMNSKTYKSGAFISDSTTWVSGVNAEGEIWLNPAIKTSSGWENVVPAGWSIKALPDGTDW